MSGICVIQYINLGILFIAVSFTGDFLGVKDTLEEQNIDIISKLGLLDGAYQEFTSGWYMKYGTLIVQTMILEIPLPHALPISLMWFFGCWKCCDRRCTCNKRRSRQMYQKDYEWLYVGSEFLLDYRLAQIVAFVHVTFMFSHSMPILFAISAFNFAVMYVTDKWLLLRVHKTPRNYDEDVILVMMQYLKFAFVFHLIAGLTMLRNGSILRGESTEGQYPEIEEANRIANQLVGFNAISPQFFKQYLILFIAVNTLLIFAVFFQLTLFRCAQTCCPCFFGPCRYLQSHLHKYSTPSDDYYNEIAHNFLVNEYDRTRMETERIAKTVTILSARGGAAGQGEAAGENGLLASLKLTEKRLLAKKQVLEDRIDELCWELEEEERSQKMARRWTQESQQN